ncbi:BTB/POZ domain-containing protein POB1 [Capsicum baccatum]|uniref:BTB/POZ domain-containing protein POB1 n=1 Tax=Capsicum baccatum TaxID=33114 RepID=A0A2G2V329_CAPBA|nr:BTB/POZ domain-containing protein POB1 [Capsicum baccatum]
MRSANNPMQRLRNALAAKTAELEADQAELEFVQVAHNAEKLELLAQIVYLQATLNLLMTTESALLYLDLPSNILMADDVQLLTNTAKKFLAAHFMDITNLPLLGIEVVLSSDDLQVASEDAVYDIALKWARKHYLKLEE